MIDPRRFIPLTQTTFYILAALRTGPKHGYAIARAVEEMSEGETRIQVGNLYVSLRRLLDVGLIERTKGEKSIRKTYRLSAVGATVFGLEIERIRRMARIGRTRVAPTATALG